MSVATQMNCDAGTTTAQGVIVKLSPAVENVRGKMPTSSATSGPITATRCSTTITHGRVRVGCEMNAVTEVAASVGRTISGENRIALVVKSAQCSGSETNRNRPTGRSLRPTSARTTALSTSSAPTATSTSGAWIDVNSRIGATRKYARYTRAPARSCTFASSTRAASDFIATSGGISAGLSRSSRPINACASRWLGSRPSARPAAAIALPRGSLPGWSRSARASAA